MLPPELHSNILLMEFLILTVSTVWQSDYLDQKQFRCLTPPESYTSKNQSPQVDILTHPIGNSIQQKSKLQLREVIQLLKYFVCSDC